MVLVCTGETAGNRALNAFESRLELVEQLLVIVFRCMFKIVVVCGDIFGDARIFDVGKQNAEDMLNEFIATEICVHPFCFVNSCQKDVQLLLFSVSNLEWRNLFHLLRRWRRVFLLLFLERFIRDVQDDIREHLAFLSFFDVVGKPLVIPVLNQRSSLLEKNQNGVVGFIVHVGPSKSEQLQGRRSMISSASGKELRSGVYDL